MSSKPRSAPTVALGDIADLRAGVGFPPAMQGRLDGELPFAKVGDISRAARTGAVGLVAPVNHISRREARELRAHVFPEGSVLFAKIGEAISQNYRVLTTTELVVDNNAMGAIPNRERVLPEYLFRYLASIDLYRHAEKTTVPALRKSVLERLPVPLPPLAEQRRIADILDKADAIRRKRKEAIALTDELLRSAFLEMFGDPVTNPKGWATRPFEEAVADVTGGNPKVQQGDYLDEGLLPVIDQGATSVGGWTDDRMLAAKVSLPTVLFGDHTRALKWVEHPFALGADGVKILEARTGVEPAYVLWACRLFKFPDVGYSRHYKFLKLWDFPVPPHDVQRRFAELLRRTARLTTPVREASRLADAVFASVQAASFRRGPGQP